MKKGVSPVVATVLLIIFTIAGAVLVYMWARGFIAEEITKYGQNAEKVCDQLSFDAAITTGMGGGYYDLYITNMGNVPIYAIDIKSIGGGKAVVDRRTISLIEGNSSKETVTIGGAYKSVIIVPVILGSIKGTQDEKPYACPRQYGKEIEKPSI